MTRAKKAAKKAAPAPDAAALAVNLHEHVTGGIRIMDCEIVKGADGRKLVRAVHTQQFVRWLDE